MSTFTLPPSVKVPTDADGFADALMDPATIKELGTKDGIRAYIKAYADQVQPAGGELSAQIRDEIARQNREMLIEAGVDPKRPDVREAVLADPYSTPEARALQGRMGLYNRQAEGAKVDGLFDNWGEYLKAVWRGALDRNTPEVQDKLGKLRNFASDIPSEGGFLIPETLRSELLRVALEMAVVRPRARVVPMETLTVPYPTIDSTTNVGSVYGGITGYWTEEGAALTASEATFGRVVLSAKKLTLYTEIPSELLTDSLSSLTQFMNDGFPEAMAFFEDLAFLTGSGVGEPLGVLNAAGKVAVTRDTDGANTINFPDIVNMASRMLPQSLNRAVWVAAIDTMPSLMQLVMMTGQTTDVVAPPLWLTGQSAIGPIPMTLLGRPIIFTEKAPKAGDAGDLSLIDFGYYLIGDRQAMQARQSEDFKFNEDKVAFRVIERVDGRPWLQSAITPANGSTATLSPYVTLAA